MTGDACELLLSELHSLGIAVRVVSAARLRELRQDLEARHRDGAFDEEFYRKRLAGFCFEPPDGCDRGGTLIVTAIPQPSVRFVFEWQGRRSDFLVPPTYLHWRETDKRVETILYDILSSAGYRVDGVNLPKKLLAVRAGLATYGKNNITYVDGMGSYHRLAVFYTDAPCSRDSWREPTPLPRCDTCVSCLRACPTGAISPDRFLLRGERCIAYLNEESTCVPFPGWLDPTWHNCLVGCLHCQTACPENRGIDRWVEEGATFSEAETALLLDGLSLDQLPASMVESLARTDLADIMDVLPRNLRVLLDNVGHRGAEPR
jgi:epoxyqueuosine reductase